MNCLTRKRDARSDERDRLGTGSRGSLSLSFRRSSGESEGIAQSRPARVPRLEVLHFLSHHTHTPTLSTHARTLVCLLLCLQACKPSSLSLSLASAPTERSGHSRLPLFARDSRLLTTAAPCLQQLLDLDSRLSLACLHPSIPTSYADPPCPSLVLLLSICLADQPSDQTRDCLLPFVRLLGREALHYVSSVFVPRLDSRWQQIRGFSCLFSL